MNLNWLAKKIAEMEGKKVAVNIAQIKEIIGCMGKIFRGLNLIARENLVNDITKRAGTRGKKK